MYYIVLYCILLNLNFTFELNKDAIFSFIVGGISWHSYSEGNKSLRRGKIAKKVHKRPASNKRKVVVILFLKKMFAVKGKYSPFCFGHNFSEVSCWFS